MADMEMNVPDGWELNKLVNIRDKNFLCQVLKGRESLRMGSQVNAGLSDSWQKSSEEFELLIPESAAEQRQIARILSTIDEAISQTQQLIAKYHRLKTGLMQDLLINDIDERGNNCSEESRTFEGSPLGHTRAEQEAKQVERITANDSPIVDDDLLVGKNSADEISVVKVKDTANNTIRVDDLPCANPVVAELFQLINSLLEVEANALAKLQVQRTGLRQDLLNGKVRVGQYFLNGQRYEQAVSASGSGLGHLMEGVVIGLTA